MTWLRGKTLFLLIALLTCTGCGSLHGFWAGFGFGEALVPSDSSPAAQDPLPNDVVIIEDDVTLDGDKIILPNTAAYAKLKKGDIVVGSSGHGFLRRIEDIQTDSGAGTITLTTSQAAITDVVQDQTVSTTIQLTPQTATSRLKLLQRAQLLDSGRIDLSGTVLVDDSGLHVEIVDGYVEFTPDFQFDLDLGWFTVDGLMFAATGTLDVSMDVVVTATASGSYHPSTTLAEFEWVFVQVIPTVPPIPLVETVQLSVVAGIDVEASVTGTLQDGCQGNASVRLGAEYDGATGTWSNISDRTIGFSAEDPALDAEGKLDAQVYVRPEINVLLYDVTGPNLNIGPYLGFNGTADLCGLDWILNAGVTSDVSFDAQIPVIDVDLGSFGPFRLIDWAMSPPLASGEMDWCIDVPLVGGSGNFSTTDGDFEVAVSPIDGDGNFIGMDLGQEAFSYQGVVLDPDAEGPDIPVNAVVTGINVDEPAPGQAVTAVLIFDSSGSMSGNDPGATGRRAGGAAFFDLLTEDDEVAVLDFGPGVSGGLSVSRLLQDFTNDRLLLDAALDQLAESGGTPLYESILDGLGLLHDELGGNGGVLVVLTDGEANSDNAFDTVVNQANAQQVPIYPVGLGNNIDFSQLQTLAQQTGGTFAEANNAAGLQAAFEGIGLAATVGKVTVFGHCTYQAADPGQYTVRGQLVTASGAINVITPFDFTAEVVP